MSKENRATVTTRNSSVAAGVDKHLQVPITIGGTTYPPADLKAVFTQHTASLETADALHKQWTDQLLAASTAGKTASRTYALLRSALIGQYGADANAVLNDFGMTAPKPRGPKTVAVKALAATRRAGTRAARHTMGKNQKKDVTWATAPAPGTPAAPEPAAGAPATGTASPIPAAPKAPPAAPSPVPPAAESPAAGR